MAVLLVQVLREDERNPQVAQWIGDYLDRAGHGEDVDEPLFRTVRGNGRAEEPRRFLEPQMVDRMVKKYVKKPSARPQATRPTPRGRRHHDGFTEWGKFGSCSGSSRARRSVDHETL